MGLAGSYRMGHVLEKTVYIQSKRGCSMFASIRQLVRWLVFILRRHGRGDKCTIHLATPGNIGLSETLFIYVQRGHS